MLKRRVENQTDPLPLCGREPISPGSTRSELTLDPAAPAPLRPAVTSHQTRLVKSASMSALTCTQQLTLKKPRDSSRSCSSLAAPPRSSQAWQRKTSRRSGRGARSSTLRRTGVSARTSAGVYDTDEPAGDQRGLALLPDPPPLLRPPPLLPDEE